MQVKQWYLQQRRSRCDTCGIARSRSSSPGGATIVRCGGTSPAGDAFEAFLRDNPLPPSRDASPGWAPEGQDAPGTLPGAPSYTSYAAGRVLQSFHWGHAQQLASTVLASHAVTWEPALNGYLCLSKREHAPSDTVCDDGDGHGAAVRKGDSSYTDRSSGDRIESSTAVTHEACGWTPDSEPAPAAAGSVGGAALRHDQPHTGARRGVRPLLLRLPRVLWTPEGARTPLLHLAAVAQGAMSPAPARIALLSADSAALAVCQGGAITRHKVLTGYTVRKKQGKAQLTHMRSSPGALWHSHLHCSDSFLATSRPSSRVLFSIVKRSLALNPASSVDICGCMIGMLARDCQREVQRSLGSPSHVKQDRATGAAGKLSVGRGIRAREARRLSEGAAARLGEWREEVCSAASLVYSGDVRWAACAPFRMQSPAALFQPSSQHWSFAI